MGSDVCLCVCVCKQKVVEQFHRDPSKPATEDVAELVFLLDKRRIEVTYHVEDFRFIPARRQFIKPQTSSETQRAEDFNADMVTNFQVRTETRSSEPWGEGSHTPTQQPVCVCVSSWTCV